MWSDEEWEALRTTMTIAISLQKGVRVTFRRCYKSSTGRRIVLWLMLNVGDLLTDTAARVSDQSQLNRASSVSALYLGFLSATILLRSAPSKFH